MRGLPRACGNRTSRPTRFPLPTSPASKPDNDGRISLSPSASRSGSVHRSCSSQPGSTRRTRYAELALRSGEADDAASQLEQLRERASDLGALTHQVAYLLGLAREAQGRLDAAALLLEDVVTSEVGVASLQAAIALCRCYRDAGDLARSIEIGESASQRAGAEGLVGTDDELRLTLTLVAAYFERGDVVYASQLCQRAIARADTEQSSPARAAAYWNASVIASERGQSREALRMADRALALLSEGDDRRNIARLKLQYGAILLVQDDPDLPSALDHLEQARVELASTDASAADIARCDVELARALFLLGDFDEATSRASGALTGLGPTAPLVAAEGNVVLGRVAAARGDMAEAHHRYRRAVGLLTAAQADREVAQLWYQLGGLLEQAGDDGGARDAFRSAAASMGLRPDVGSSVSA